MLYSTTREAILEKKAVIFRQALASCRRRHHSPSVECENATSSSSYAGIVWCYLTKAAVVV